MKGCCLGDNLYTFRAYLQAQIVHAKQDALKFFVLNGLNIRLASASFQRCRQACSSDVPHTFVSSPSISSAAPAQCSGPSASSKASQPVVRPTKGTSSVKGATRWVG